VPNQPRADNPVRYIRVEDQLWQRAQARADRDGVKVSAVVRAALEEYVSEEQA
jgi:antitoxin component of RelBE/YafQ-DinJ toxin-antitoxin module